MTTIISVPDERTGETVTASSGQSAQQKSKWLYELERAQWQAKQRPASSDRNLPQSRRSETSCPDQPQEHTAKFTANNDLESASETKQQAVMPSKNAHLQRPNDMGGAKAILPSSDYATAMPIAAPVPIPGATGKTLADQIMPLESSPGVTSTDRKWDKLRAHMEEKDGEINLWLRDTRLDAPQGIQLAMALRKRFAALGHRLACFTLNGRALPLDPPLTNSNHS